MANQFEATGDNFILTFVKDGLAYPVVLSDEQKEAFNMILPIALQGQVNIGKEPIGKAMTLGELKKMKEGNK
nr:MAG TPA: hypothetical protein [Caudoviricetes sp.]